MTIHANIGEAKTRLSELVAAALRGEEVVISRAGIPQVRLVPVAEVSDEERKRIATRRKAAFGMWKQAFEGWDPIVPPSMTDDELEERFQRKLGPEL
jgi:prevent-host-death family protein